MIKLKHLLSECNECGRDWNHGHDHEAGMAKNELRDAISNASKIDQMIGEGDNLPGWVSAYISLAADYMHSVAEYLAGESSRMQQPGPGYGMEESVLSEITPGGKEIEQAINSGKLDPEEVKKAAEKAMHGNSTELATLMVNAMAGLREAGVRKTRGDVGRTHSASSRDYGVPYTPKTDYRVGQKFHHKEHGTGEILKVEPSNLRDQAIEKGATIFVKFVRKDEHGNNVVKNLKLKVRTLDPSER